MVHLSSSPFVEGLNREKLGQCKLKVRSGCSLCHKLQTNERTEKEKGRGVRQLLDYSADETVPLSPYKSASITYLQKDKQNLNTAGETSSRTSSTVSCIFVSFFSNLKREYLQIGGQEIMMLLGSEY